MNENAINTVENKKESKLKAVKMGIRLAVGGLVELFVGAVTKDVLSGVEGNKLSKFGAKAGGFLVGMYIGDRVSNYICGEIDDVMESVEELKNSIEEGE